MPFPGVLYWLVVGLLLGALVHHYFERGHNQGGVVTAMSMTVIGAGIGGFVGSSVVGDGFNHVNFAVVAFAAAGALALYCMWRVGAYWSRIGRPYDERFV